MRYIGMTGFLVVVGIRIATAGSVAITTPEGDLTQYLLLPSSRVERMDPSRLQNLPTDQPLDWRAALQERVTATERLLRSGPPADAGDAEQSQSQATFNEQLAAQVKDLPGKVVDVSIVVEKVIERMPPRAPGQLYGDVSAEEQKQYDLKMKLYESQFEQFRSEQYCVVGRVPWQQPMLVLPAEWRKKLATMTAVDQAKAVQGWRDQCPEHFVAFYASGKQVAHWKPGQERRVLGAVQAAGQICRTPLFHLTSANYTVPECCYIQMDLFVVPYQLFDPLGAPPEAKP